MPNSSTSPSPDAEAPTGIEAQRSPLQEIAQAIVNLLPADCESEIFTVRATASMRQSTLNAYRADGSVVHLKANLALMTSVGDLRASMYKPGTGTWFSAVFTANSAGSVDAKFDYDSEPAWTGSINPAIYVDDLNEFPREDEHIPDWLRRGVEAAKSGVTALPGLPLD